MTEPREQRDESAEAPRAPRPLRVAAALWIASALVSAVNSFARLADRSQLVQQLRQAAPGLGQDQIDAAASGGVAFGVVLVLLILGVFVLLAWRMVQGYNWARIVLTVFGGIGVFFTTVGLLGLAAGAGGGAPVQLGGFDVVVSVVGLGLEVTALVLMFHPRSTEFIRERSASRPKQQRTF